MMNNNNTNVLLLIVPNQHSVILPHSLFYRLFSPYGEVVRILIFEKARVWKAFLEMGNPAEAQRAQNNLNGTQIFEGSTMSVQKNNNKTLFQRYFSSLKSVTFLNNNSGGIDYREIRMRNDQRSFTYQDHQFQPSWSNKVQSQPELNQPYTPVQLFNYDYNYPPLNQPSKKSIDQNRTRASTSDSDNLEFNRRLRNGQKQNSNLYQTSMDLIVEPDQELETSPQHSHSRRSKSVNSLKVQECFDEEEKDQEDDSSSQNSQDDHYIMSAFTNDKNSFMFSLPQLYQKQESTQSLINEFEGLTLQSEQFQDFSMIDPSTYVSPQFLLENQPSKVVYIRGLTYHSLTPINIFNLLSNCGNVVVIIFIKHKASALVQFEKLSHAQNAKDHLNNLPFFCSKLKIFYSNYQEIQFPLPYQSPQTMIFIPTKDQFRFSEGKSISFNPPSQTLHLSNLKSSIAADDRVLKDIFQGIGQIQAVKYMHLSKQKHMALVKLSSIEEALNGAALLHGTELMGRKINVSFTKSKLC